jgi:DNA-binding CsgD family transcriptional regulator
MIPTIMLKPVLAAVAAAAEAASLRELADGALPHLQQAIGASNALFYRYSTMGLDGVAGSLAAETRAYTLDLLAGDPLQALPRRLAPGAKVVMITEDVGRQAYHRSDAYNLFYRPRDLEHVACAWLSSNARYGEAGMTGILFGRAPGEEAFSRRDVALLREALPVLAAAVRRCQRTAVVDERRGALEMIAASSVGRPLIAFSRSGGVLWMSSPAATLLGPRAMPPAALVDDARELAAFTDGSGERARLPRTARRFVLENGSVAHAHLSVARLPNEAVVVLAELVAQAAAPDALTRAERDVLRILALGVSNREIAERLVVSVETVRTHVARILAKTRTATRTEAAVKAQDWLR